MTLEIKDVNKWGAEHLQSRVWAAHPSKTLVSAPSPKVSTRCGEEAGSAPCGFLF